MISSNSPMDPETLWSFGRQVYGHEIWIGDVFREGDEICAYALYGHKMVPDKPMPTDYANPVLYDDDGRVEDPDREIVKEPHGWKLSFEDKGADVYTLYVGSKSVWVTDEEGWHRGSKRDFSQVKHSGAYVMTAKRIISKNGSDPGDVMHAELELMPSRAKLKVGEDLVMTVYYDGKPLPNHKVLCYCHAAEDIQFVNTDDKGVMRYPVKEKGDYIFIVKFSDENKKVDDEFDDPSFTTTLTLETE